ncbi:MAG: hypothetical protein P1U61_07740 [Legionellaceae bacterium]|nr:hypothetical protein [Legionellaceae bacterium]
MTFNRDKLVDFIEMRSDLCDDSVLLDGVTNLSQALIEEPTFVMDIIENHPFIPATFLLEELSEKVNKQNKKPHLNCVNNLGFCRKIWINVKKPYFWRTYAASS